MNTRDLNSYYDGALDSRTLATSLRGRAAALDQVAGFVELLPVRRRNRYWRDEIARYIRSEAELCRRDIEMARKVARARKEVGRA
jgi:hypothetical protein